MMKRFFPHLAAGLAVYALLLMAASPVAARNGKSAFGGFRSSGAGSSSSFRSNISSSPRMMRSSPSKLSNSMAIKNAGNFNRPGLGSRSFQKARTSSFLSKTNKFSHGGTTLRSLGSTNTNFPKRNLNNALLSNSKLNRGLTNRGSFNNKFKNNTSRADAVKNGSLGAVVNRGGIKSGNTGAFKGGANLADRGKLLDTIKNGGLKPVTDTNTTPPKFGNLPNRPDLTARGKIIDKIKDGGLNPIGGSTEPDGGNLPNRPSFPIDRGSIIDKIKDGNFPPIGGGNNAPPEAGNDPGTPGEPADNVPPPADHEPPVDAHDPPYCPEDPHHCPPHDHCHPHFPWWPVVIDGGHYCGPVGCPPATHVTVVEQPIAVSVETAAETVAMDAAPGADLELFDLRMVDAGDAARQLGPRYRVVFRNRGTAPAGNFQVLLMASRDGTPNAESPLATAEVEALAAGETRSVDIRLPMSADLTAMPALIVAVDSAVQVAETDEQNNVAVLDRAKIAMSEVTTVAGRQTLGN